MFTKCVEGQLSKFIDEVRVLRSNVDEHPLIHEASPPDAARHPRRLSIAPAVGGESEWEQFRQSHHASRSDDNARSYVRSVDLPNEFAAAAAWRNDAGAAHSDDRIDFRLSSLQHFGNRGMLSAKTKAAGSVDTNASVDVPTRANQSRRHATGDTVIARLELTNKLFGSLNEIVVSHLDSLLWCALRPDDWRITSGALAVRWRTVGCMRCWAANPEESRPWHRR
jgi:hypothetical protein